MKFSGLKNMLGAAVSRLTPPRERPPGFIVFPEHDDEMKAAIAQALATFDLFWAKFESPEAEIGDYQVKAGLTTPNEATEHIWLTVLAREGDKIRGVVANEPVDLEDISVGDEVLVEADRLCDWSYWKNDLLFGAYTMRAMMPHMSAEERAQGEAVLSAQPLEIDLH